MQTLQEGPTKRTPHQTDYGAWYDLDNENAFDWNLANLTAILNISYSAHFTPKMNTTAISVRIYTAQKLRIG